MRGLLLDSKFMTILNRIGELVILNICYLVCCIPIVTVGAAITGLYTVCFRFGTARERGALGSFFRAFLANLKQGILLWLIGLAVGLFSAYFALLFFTMGGVIHYAFIPFLVLLALCLVVFSYAFPLLSQFENTVAQTLKNAAILSLGYLPRSICIAAVNLLPVILLLFYPMLFLRIGILWFFLYFSAAAYLNTFLQRKVFTPYWPKEDGKEAEENA